MLGAVGHQHTWLGDGSVKASHPAVTWLDVRVTVFLLTESDLLLVLTPNGSSALRKCGWAKVFLTASEA